MLPEIAQSSRTSILDEESGVGEVQYSVVITRKDYICSPYRFHLPRVGTGQPIL
jgi:hypothetical protein